MLLRALVLAGRQSDVVVFERSSHHLGAWRYCQIASESQAVFANAVYPTDVREVAALPQVVKLLEDLGIRFEIKRPAGILGLVDTPPFEIVFQPLEILRLALNSSRIEICQEEVSEVAITSSHITVCERKFSRLVLPSRFTPISFDYEGTTFESKPQVVTSQHLVAVFEGRTLFECLGSFYRNPFDEVFDRGRISDNGDYSLFRGRVSRGYKASSTKELLNHSSFLQPRLDLLRSADRHEYDDFQHTVDHLEELRSFLQGSAVQLANTRNFIVGASFLHSEFH